jgi:membrane dipeptidase
MNSVLLFDAHLDLALNALDWNRNLRLGLAEIRARESGLRDKPGRSPFCLGSVPFEALSEVP